MCHTFTTVNGIEHRQLRVAALAEGLSSSMRCIVAGLAGDKKQQHHHMRASETAIHVCMCILKFVDVLLQACVLVHIELD
jgi:hypothetical protein